MKKTEKRLSVKHTKPYLTLLHAALRDRASRSAMFNLKGTKGVLSTQKVTVSGENFCKKQNESCLLTLVIVSDRFSVATTIV